MNIYEKMSEAGKEIARVPKNLTVGTGKSQYKAVAEADILKAVKEAEEKYKIFSFPFAHEIEESRTIITRNDYGEKESQFVRIKAVYRFLDMENPAEYVEVTAYGDGVDSLDKAPGKATTYADKYALMKAYKIETGDDSDRSASDDLSGHDIWKIKQRVDLLMTEKMSRGMSEEELIASMGITKKQFDACMNAFQNVAAIEAKLRKV